MILVQKVLVSLYKYIFTLLDSYHHVVVVWMKNITLIIETKKANRDVH